MQPGVQNKNGKMKKDLAKKKKKLIGITFFLFSFFCKVSDLEETLLHPLQQFTRAELKDFKVNKR